MELFLNCTEYYKETKNADFSIQKLAQHKVVEHMQKKRIKKSRNATGHKNWAIAK